jgi:hypothetical protein
MLRWWRRWREERASRAEAIDKDLPFTADEMGRLIMSGRRDDFRRLAAGLSDDEPLN